MGNCVSTIKRRKEPKKAITLAIIGLDNAGKTTMCYVLTGEQLDPDLAPTVGFRNVKFSHSNFDVTVFDLGGGESIRPIWKTYFGEVFGVVYVIDSTTPSRLYEARENFKATLEHPQVSGKPVLILANKVDNVEHMKEDDIIKGLLLESTKITSKCPSKLVMVSALKGVGSKMDKEIEKGLHWLFESIRTSLSSLEPRIEKDMKTAKETQEKEREERKARVKKQREEREKAEELERTRLGLGKKEDSDEDDIIVGDPFKALDLDKLKKKEQEMKEEKLLIQERKQQLASNDEMRKDNARGLYTADADGNHKTISTNEDVFMKDLSISEGLTLHLDDVDYSAITLQGRRSQASALPPLEPIESQYKDNLTKTTSKIKNRKKKKLTDYHLQSHNKMQSHGNDLNQEIRADATSALEFTPHANVLSDISTNVLDQNTQFDHPKKLRAVHSRKVSKNEEEIDQFNESEDKHLNQDSNVDGLKYSKRQMADGMSSQSHESKEENIMKGYDTVSYGSGDSKHRKSKKKVHLSHLNELGGHETEEGIDVSNKSNLEDHDMKSQKRLNKNGKFTKSKRVKNSLTNLLSDEENNSYASHNSLKDTLRFPLSPTYVEDLRSTNKGTDDPRKHGDDFKQSETYEGVENGGFIGHRISTINQSNGAAGNYHGNARNSHPHIMVSPNRDEETVHKNKVSEKTEVRRKKKHNFLRSNRVTPSDDENMKFASEEMLGTPRVVHESGSKSLQEVRTPAKNRNTTITSYQRNISQDSDFGTKWGLAEDLPAVDGGFGGFRVPNFDSNEEGDSVL